MGATPPSKSHYLQGVGFVVVSSMLLTQAIDDFLHWKSTHMDNPKAYRVALRPLLDYCGNRETKDVSIKDITTIASQMKGNTFMFLTVLKIFARYCHWGKIEFINPHLIKVKRRYDPTDRSHLVKKDIDLMCSVLDDDTVLGVRNQLLIRLLADTGCRLSEVLGIKISDFVKAEREEEKPVAEITSLKIVTKKAKTNRYIAWSDETHKLLLTYMGMRISKNWKSDYLFINKNGKPLEPRGAQHMFKKVSEEALGETHHIHETRHYKAKRILDLGGDIFSVKTILGHSGLSSALTYLRLYAQESRTIAKFFVKA